MADYWPPRAAGGGDHWPPRAPVADHCSSLRDDRRQSLSRTASEHSNTDNLRRLPAASDRIALIQLQQENSSLVVNTKTISQQLLQNHGLEFTQQITSATKEPPLGVTWIEQALVLTFSNTKVRDASIIQLRAASAFLGQLRIVLDVFALLSWTNLDLISSTPRVVPPAAALSGVPSSRHTSSALPREYTGEYLWWSTFVHAPHTIKHVIEAVFQYFLGRSRPQFIAGQFGMPEGVVLIHFAVEPAWDQNFVTLQNPTLNTGIKSLHDLDLAICRLQLQAGTPPERHTGHRCAVRGLGNPGQGVPGNSQYQVIAKQRSMSASVCSTSVRLNDGRPHSPELEMEILETRNALRPVPSTAAINGNPTQQRRDLVNFDIQATRERAKIASTKASQAGDLLVPGQASAHSCMSDDTTKIANTQHMSEYASPRDKTASGASIIPFGTSLAHIEQMIDEERVKISTRSRRGSTNQSPKSLTFADIEAESPLDAINFYHFCKQLRQTQAWSAIALNPFQKSPEETAQCVEAFCCFIAHYYRDSSWDDKIAAFNRRRVSGQGPKVHRAFEHFTVYLRQQKRRGVTRPSSFPYYGPRDRAALSREIRLYPGSVCSISKQQNKSLATIRAPCSQKTTQSSVVAQQIPGYDTIKKIETAVRSQENLEIFPKEPPLQAPPTIVKPPTGSLSPSINSPHSISSLDSWELFSGPERMVYSPSMQLLYDELNDPAQSSRSFANAIEAVQKPDKANFKGVEHESGEEISPASSRSYITALTSQSNDATPVSEPPSVSKVEPSAAAYVVASEALEQRVRDELGSGYIGVPHQNLPSARISPLALENEDGLDTGFLQHTAEEPKDEDAVGELNRNDGSLKHQVTSVTSTTLDEITVNNRKRKVEELADSMESQTSKAPRLDSMEVMDQSISSDDSATGSVCRGTAIHSRPSGTNFVIPGLSTQDSPPTAQMNLGRTVSASKALASKSHRADPSKLLNVSEHTL